MQKKCLKKLNKFLYQKHFKTLTKLDIEEMDPQRVRYDLATEQLQGQAHRKQYTQQ